VTNSSQTPPLFEKEVLFKNTLKSGKNKNMVMDPNGARNQRGPAAIYWAGLRIEEQEAGVR
jgi:hypothetical protein